MDIQVQIEAILANRKTQLPKIKKQIAHWNGVKSHLSSLNATIQDVLQSPDLKEDLRQSLRNIPPLDVQHDISSTLLVLDDLTERFNRDSINIGVSGQARVGKSTLLQTVSGLTEEQIPTGDNLPVTAVKSQIYHTDKNGYASVEFHSFQSFKEHVLKPYHDELGLNCPYSIAEFQTFDYPKDENDLIESKRNTSNITILEKLKQMQIALWSYQDLLNQPPQKIALDVLREYVAYPTHQQEQYPASCTRKYLAVKDVKIYCQFPHTPVKQLGLIDLPGLGELSASVEAHHLDGLKKGVDFVILVKRPGGTEGFWTAKDGAAADLLDKARSYQDRQDFVNILINKRADVSQDQIDALQDHIHREVNQGEKNRVFKLIEADAKNQDSVTNDVLQPVLQHLADRLKIMDQKIIEGTLNNTKNMNVKIQKYLQDLSNVLKQPVYTGSKREEIEGLAKDLQDNLAEDLQELVNELRSQDGDEYSEKIDECYQDIQNWIENGFDNGLDKWKQDAQKAIRRTTSAAGFAVDQCNEIRVEISKRFAKLDSYFNEHLLAHFFERIVTILKQHTGQLLLNEHQDNKTVIEQFRQYLLEAQEDEQMTPCNNLAEALENLSKLQLEYRSQLHPRVRNCLNCLESSSGDSQYRFQSTNNADQLYKEISELAEQATYETRNALQEDVSFPQQVLFAAAEQLEDEFIRGKASEKELKRLAFSYTSDLWSEHFQDVNTANARINKIRRQVNELRTALTDELN